jgi:hypothetical protein
MRLKPVAQPPRSATHRSNNMSDYAIVDTHADNIGYGDSHEWRSPLAPYSMQDRNK